MLGSFISSTCLESSSANNTPYAVCSASMTSAKSSRLKCEVAFSRVEGLLLCRDPCMLGNRGDEGGFNCKDRDDNAGPCGLKGGGRDKLSSTALVRRD